MRISITALLVCILFYNKALAQTSGIAVRVTASGLGIDAATVSLLNAKDSSWIRSEITDDKGASSFSNIASGKYIVTASSVGYKAGMQTVELKDSQTYTCSIQLQKESTALTEVAVTAKKPFIEMSLGKTVVNIEGSSTTGTSNVLDLMGRLPGLIVDQDGTITMRSKAGVLVLIDDRPTYLSGEALAEYLKTITADETAQIELITQPGAKYDAAGNTGIINIKLRKNKKQGWNGNTSLSWQQGVYYNRNENFMVSYKKNKLNISLNGSDMEAIGFADWHQQISYTDGQGNTFGTNTNHSTPKERFSHTTLRLALDYNLSEKTTIGVNVRGAYHPNKMRSYVASTYHDYTNSATTYNTTVAMEGHIRKELVTNAYISHKFSKDHTLDVNLDYLSFSKNADQEFTITRYNEQMQPIQPPVITNSFQKSPIAIYSFKADHAYGFKNGLKLESGVKVSQVTMDFDAAFHLFENNEWINDARRTNHFLYSENINASYITMAKKLGKKWEAHAGLRIENTVATGVQFVNNDRFTKNYTSLFPTAFLAYNADTNNQFELDYGRRIDRPEYKQLNPFVYYSFQNMYDMGNPSLMPQYTNNVELKHSYKNTVITLLAYSRTTDVIQGFMTVNDSSKLNYNTQRNIASNSSVYLSVSFNKDIFKWWSLNASGSVFYADFEGIFNNEWKKVEWSGYSLHGGSRFDLTKGWKAEFYARYNSAGKWSLTSSFEPIIVVECGASKKIDDRWSARLFAHDPFYLFRLNAKDYGVNYRAGTRYRNASQSFALSLTYTFGSQQHTRTERSLDEANRL